MDIGFFGAQPGAKIQVDHNHAEAKILCTKVIANSRIMNERSNETLPICRFGTTRLIALSGGSVKVNTVSESNKTGPRGRHSRAKIETYSRTNLVIKIKT